MNVLRAAKAGDVSAIQAAIERGADIEAKDDDGCTPLARAALDGHERCRRRVPPRPWAVPDFRDFFPKVAVGSRKAKISRKLRAWAENGDLS